MKKCLRCSKLIITGRLDKKYCSKTCRKKTASFKKARRGQNRLWKRGVTSKAKLKYISWIEIEKIYDTCPTGHEVDHIIPLKHELVCGLHVPCNLQYLTPKQNRDKGSKI